MRMNAVVHSGQVRIGELQMPLGRIWRTLRHASFLTSFSFRQAGRQAGRQTDRLADRQTDDAHALARRAHALKSSSARVLLFNIFLSVALNS
ncbi:jg4896 [Pararge aegeria aegeria]|uniref:Jg4896 protein n=1 Tax=Pararge aegeria aegeria TaxID=348720 RepID=A0A8S4RKF1_9NEOP|nr:jg4896 [Pararge aegeria aegeria]